MNGSHVSPQPLKVIIVGAGIGGLTAAIALRRQGHHVALHEAAAAPNEAGAAINIVPNADSVLLKLGVDVLNSGAVPLKSMRILKSSGELLDDRNMLSSADRWQARWLLTHRAHLHEYLKSVAISQSGPGKPASLHYAHRVSEVFPQTATVSFEDGSTAHADIVVGADGVHSVTRKAISPTTNAQRGKHSAFRFLVSRQAALEDPMTADFFTRTGCMDLCYAEDRKIVIYPCANNEMFNFVCIHPAGLSDTSGGYNNSTSSALMLKIFSEFAPVLLAMLEKADPKSLRVYPLFDMDTLPTFVSGRMALIGDAAHPFLPHLAQGGAMAIEDGVSLGVMLSGAQSTDELEARLQLYNNARYERATRMQEYTRIVGGDSVKKDETTTGQLSLNDYLEYGLSHDEFDASNGILQKWRQARDPHVYRRQPIAFGPLPGTRSNQPVESASRTATIVFKTSATYLRNLLPSSAYAFGSRDTVAYASFRLHILDNVASLGGASQYMLGLYIHNIQYTTKSGKAITGTYLPVVFEDLNDPTTSFSGVIGFPRVWSNFSVDASDHTYTATLSWAGQIWAKLNWPDLSAEKDTADHGASDETLLVHRYLPGADRQEDSPPDADDTVMIPLADPRTQTTLHKRDSSDHASVTFNTCDEQRFPVLHRIVSSLAAIPIYEVVEAFVEENVSMPDFTAGVEVESNVIS